MVTTALTIAGSDPSGGAGIQADIKTFSRLGVYGMSVITALTVQNTTGVSDVMDVPVEMVAGQMDAVIRDIPPDAVKIGMLGNASITELVAARIREHGVRYIVLDPVLVSTSGASLLRGENAMGLFKTQLAPLALLITPNIGEAEALTGLHVRDTSDMQEAARRLCDLGARNVLVKGGHLEGDAVDVFYDGSQFHHFSAPRIPAPDAHGTGCVLSAAIAAYLARGESLYEAVRMSKQFVTEAIRGGLRIGKGRGPCNAAGI